MKTTTNEHLNSVICIWPLKYSINIHALLEF